MTEEQQTGSLAQAMHDMSGRVDRDSRNKHGGWDYASADAVYAGVRKELAAQGLAPFMQQVRMEIKPYGKKNDGNERLWIEADYNIALTPDGRHPEEECDFELVTVMAEFLSAQAFQAIRTYALKYFLRGKLLIQTGEPDVDNDEQRHPHQGQQQQHQAQQAAKPAAGEFAYSEQTKKITYTQGIPKKDAAGIKDFQRALMSFLQSNFKHPCTRELALVIWEANQDLINLLPTEGIESLQKQCGALPSGEAPTQDGSK